MVDAEEPVSQSSERVVRRARVAWLTRPPGGTGYVGIESKAFGALAVSLPEFDPVPRESTPGELLAATHATFMCWAVAEALAEIGSQAEELVVEAECTFAGPVAGRYLVAVDLFLRARIPELPPTLFDGIVSRARRQYRHAAGLRAKVAGHVHAKLLTT